MHKTEHKVFPCFNDYTYFIFVPEVVILIKMIVTLSVRASLTSLNYLVTFKMIFYMNLLDLYALVNEPVAI